MNNEDMKTLVSFENSYRDSKYNLEFIKDIKDGKVSYWVNAYERVEGQKGSVAVSMFTEQQAIALVRALVKAIEEEV